MLSEGRNIRNVISRDLNGGLEKRADKLWEGRMSSTWPSVLNSQDNTLSMGENGWKSDQHGRRC